MSDYQHTDHEKKRHAGSGSSMVPAVTKAASLTAVPVLQNMAAEVNPDRIGEAKEDQPVQRFIASPNVGFRGNSPIQLAPWTNQVAKFKTANGMPDVPMSEYDVQATTYRRYAPINEQRAPGQVFQEGERSFAYIQPSAIGILAAADTSIAVPHRNKPDVIKLSTDNTRVWASRKPANGLHVWDANVDAHGVVSHQHNGHEVVGLGGALEHLDNPGTVTAARAHQAQVRHDQRHGRIPSDKEMDKLVYDWIDKTFARIKDQGARDNAGFKHLRAHPEVLESLVANLMKEKAVAKEVAKGAELPSVLPPDISMVVASFLK